MILPQNFPFNFTSPTSSPSHCPWVKVLKINPSTYTTKVAKIDFTLSCSYFIKILVFLLRSQLTIFKKQTWRKSVLSGELQGKEYMVEVGMEGAGGDGGEGCSPWRHRKRVSASTFPARSLSALGKCCIVLSALKHSGWFLRDWIQLHATVSWQAVVGLFMETAARSPALAIQALTQTILTVNGPSLLLLEDRSPSAFTLSASTIPENVSKTTSCSMMDPMLILHPPGPIVSQWVEQAFKKSNYHFRIIKVALKGMFKGRHAITEHNILLLMQIQFSDFPVYLGSTSAT